MTAATLKRRVIELESKTTDQDTELEVLHILRDRLREAGQLREGQAADMDDFDNPDNLTGGALVLAVLKRKHGIA